MMASKDKLLDKLSESMDNRFGDVGSGILCDTKIVSFQQWPDPKNSAGKQLNATCNNLMYILFLMPESSLIF